MLPISAGWNYLVRLYRPRPGDPGRILDVPGSTSRSSDAETEARDEIRSVCPSQSRRRPNQVVSKMPSTSRMGFSLGSEALARRMI